LESDWKLHISKDVISVTLQFSFADLDYPLGRLYFDVYTSGGGGTDSAVDALPIRSIHFRWVSLQFRRLVKLHIRPFRNRRR